MSCYGYWTVIGTGNAVVGWDPQLKGGKQRRRERALDREAVHRSGTTAHPLLAPDRRTPGWANCIAAYKNDRRRRSSASGAELMLVYSTQWFSVIGHSDAGRSESGVGAGRSELVRARGDPVLVPRSIRSSGSCIARRQVVRDAGVDGELSRLSDRYRDGRRAEAAQPEQRHPGLDRLVQHLRGARGDARPRPRRRARRSTRYGKKTIVVVVSNLSNRYEVAEIDPAHDRISSQKDDEWNRKILEMLGEGRLEDVAQVAREFGREANADMGFKAIWWLGAVAGEHNKYDGKVWEYAPVWGTGNAHRRADAEAAEGDRLGEGVRRGEPVPRPRRGRDWRRTTSSPSCRRSSVEGQAPRLSARYDRRGRLSPHRNRISSSPTRRRSRSVRIRMPAASATCCSSPASARAVRGRTRSRRGSRPRRGR